MIQRILIGTFAAACAFGQAPQIFYRGVVNAASFAAQGLPGGAIAQGSMFTIFGRNLGPSSSPALAFPLATTLGGVSVSVTQGSSVLNAIPVFVSPGQINAILPSTAAPGPASLRVTYNNARSNPMTIRVAPASPGLFTATGLGQGPGIAQNASLGGQPLNSLAATASAGQVMILWGTGLGPVSYADNIAPQAGDLPTPVEIYVGGKPARKLYSGRTPCCSGIDQLAFEVPADAPAGCWVPVYVRANGVLSNVVTMAIGTDSGATCADSANPLSQTFINGGKMGWMNLIRATMRQDLATVSTADIGTEVFAFTFADEKGSPFAFAPYVSAPPPGTCTVYTATGDMLRDTKTPRTATWNGSLDAGAFTLIGPGGPRTLTPLNALIPAGFIGSSANVVPGLPNQLFLNPGQYTLRSAGGADLKAFDAQVTIPAAFTWTNRDTFFTIDRTKDLTVNWSGTTSGQSVAVFGGSVDQPSNSSAFFYCIAPAAATSFTVPAAVLSAIPPARADVSKFKSVLYLTTMPFGNATAVDAPGLDTAVVMTPQMTGKTVLYQ